MHVMFLVQSLTAFLQTCLEVLKTSYPSIRIFAALVVIFFKGSVLVTLMQLDTHRVIFATWVLTKLMFIACNLCRKCFVPSLVLMCKVFFSLRQVLLFDLAVKVLLQVQQTLPPSS